MPQNTSIAKLSISSQIQRLRGLIWRWSLINFDIAHQTKIESYSECYDISHTDGRFTVASRSVLVNSKGETSLYRKYQIKDIPDGKIDDFASMRWWGDVTLASEWKNQISRISLLLMVENDNSPAALEGIEKGREFVRWELSSEGHSEEEILNSLVISPQICFLAKRLEKYFSHIRGESIRFEVASSELRVFQKIRDEAHRFAITFNRSKTNKGDEEEFTWGD